MLSKTKAKPSNKRRFKVNAITRKRQDDYPTVVTVTSLKKKWCPSTFHYEVVNVYTSHSTKMPLHSVTNQYYAGAFIIATKTC